MSRCDPDRVTVRDQDDAVLRVSDADREETVAALREHLAAGRLTFDEFSDRVGEAYAARTAGDLRCALRELPSAPVEQPGPGEPRRRGRRIPYAVSRFVSVNTICIGVWAASGGHYFWPIWVIIPTGAMLLRRCVAPMSPYPDGRHHGHGHDHGHDLPDPPAPEQRTPSEPPVGRVVMSVLFTDIVGSTERAASLGDAAWQRVLDDYLHSVEDELRRCHGETLFTKGDEIVAGFASPAAAVGCAAAIRDHAHSLGLEVRVGVHAGEVDRRGNTANGIAMHIGQRVCASAMPGQILVSSTVHDLLVGSSIGFTEAGEHALKGLDGTWRLYEPTGATAR